MAEKIRKGTIDLWVEMSRYFVVPRSMKETQNRFFMQRQRVEHNVERMVAYGVPIEKRKVLGHGYGSVRFVLTGDLEDAVCLLQGKPQPEKKIEPAAMAVKKIAKKKRCLRDVSADMRSQKAPWFVLTTECVRLF